MRLLWEERSGRHYGPDGGIVLDTPEWVMRGYDAGETPEGPQRDTVRVTLQMFPEHNREKAWRGIVTLSKDSLDGDILKEMKERLLYEGKRAAAIADSEVKPLTCRAVRREGLVPTDYPVGVPCCTGCHNDFGGEHLRRRVTLRDGRYARVCCAVHGYLEQRRRLAE